MIKRGLLIGTVSGFALGFFLKAVELMSGHLVYTLLLNVDFIPVIGPIDWPEAVEFFFHLIISWLIGITYVLLRDKWRYSSFSFAFCLTFPTIFLFFPLSVLSLKDVPAWTDTVAFAWWVAGHAVYLLTFYGTDRWLAKKQRY